MHLSNCSSLKSMTDPYTKGKYNCDCGVEKYELVQDGLVCGTVHWFPDGNVTLKRWNMKVKKYVEVIEEVTLTLSKT